MSNVTCNITANDKNFAHQTGTCLVMRLTWKFAIFFYQKGCVGQRQRWLLCGGMCFNDFCFLSFPMTATMPWTSTASSSFFDSFFLFFLFWHLLHFIVIAFIFILCPPWSFANQIALLFSLANAFQCLLDGS